MRVTALDAIGGRFRGRPVAKSQAFGPSRLTRDSAAISLPSGDTATASTEKRSLYRWLRISTISACCGPRSSRPSILLGSPSLPTT